MKNEESRIAYDICPVNIVLNSICEDLGLPYDDQGNIARQGALNDDLLSKLNALPFYNNDPPFFQ